MPSYIHRDGICVFRPLMRAGNQRTTRMNTHIKAVAKARAGNANHHLWNNNGTWWFHLTCHLPDYTKRRVRLSLETSDVELARRLRDSTLALFGCRFQVATQEAA